MSAARVSASQLYSLEVCPHRLAMDAFADPATRDPVSPFVQMLWERGSAYEDALIGGLGVPSLDLSGERGEVKERATRAALARGEPLIYNGRLTTATLLGEPDLLRREGGGYVAIDIKSGAGEEGEAGSGKPKPKYGVQIALYADLLQELGCAAGRYGYIWDGQGREVRYDLDAPTGKAGRTLWGLYEEARATAAAILERRLETQPALTSGCKLCVWRSACTRVLEDRDDLTLLPELGRARREKLAPAFADIAALATADVDVHIARGKTSFPGIGPETLRRLQARARLQKSRDPKPYWWEAVELPRSAVELFFDIEDDPLRELVYLHGFVVREGGDSRRERFIGCFAHAPTADGERAAFEAAWSVLRKFPHAVVYYYSAHEKTQYRALQERHPDVCTAEEVEALFSAPRSFDLYTGAARKSEWPTRDYSVKSLAKCLGFRWRDVDPSGAASIEWFEQWVRTGDEAVRRRILEYNEDDCRAMRVVLDGMRRMKARP